MARTSDGPARLVPNSENADDKCIALNFEEHTHLGWSHYISLLREKDSQRLRFYFEQAATQRWSVRELTHAEAAEITRSLVV